MKKKRMLVLAMILSMAVCLTDVMAITTVVRAQDITDEEFSESQPENVPDGAGYDDEYEAFRMQQEEEAARWAEEEASKAAQDEANREAQRIADEEERARKEAVDNRDKKEDEEDEEDEDQNEEDNEYHDYYLSVTLASNPINSIDFGTAMVGEQRDYKPIYVTNQGYEPINLIASKTGDADGAFSMTLHGDTTYIEPGQSALYYISMRSDLLAGAYSAKLLFASMDDPTYTNAKKIELQGVVQSDRPVISSVTVSPSSTSVSAGSTYTFNAVVNGMGYYDDSVRWSISGNRSTGTYISGNGSSGTLTVASDETSSAVTVMASSLDDPSMTGYSSVTIQRNSYTVNAYSDPQRGGQVTGGGAVPQGGSVTLSAIPNTNYYFEGWVRDGKTVSTATNYTINDVRSNINVTARFAAQYVTVTVGVNNSNGGTVNGGGNISYGGTTTLSARAYSGYAFTGWKEGDSIVSKDASIQLKNLTVDRKLTAMFERTSHTLTVAADPASGGKVTGGGTFKLGTGTTVKAEANDGYEFTGWYVNGQVVSRDALYGINRLDQDCTITARFEKKGITYYEISSGVATTGGTISPGGRISFAQGESVTYIITPKTGYAVLAVAVDGVMVGPVTSYTFSNIQGPHIIAVAFVLTDAGRNAAETSGKKVQAEKVQVITKSEENTATEVSTVDFNDAANGEGGDEFVEEMNLEGIQIPSDEELGVLEPKQEISTDVTQMLGMSFEEVSTMIYSGNVRPVLDASFYSGKLNAHVKNELEPKKLKGIDYQSLSTEELMQLSDDVINPSLPDLDDVVESMLSTDEILKMANGEEVSVSVSLTLQESDPVTESLMKTAVGQKPLKYFDMTVLKSAGGLTQLVTVLPSTMEVVIEIPDDVYTEGKKYSVLRIHNGEMKVLPDLDDDPKTITFRTDRFSSYAISQQITSTRNILTWLVAGALVSFGIAITCMLIMIVSHNKRRLKKYPRIRQ